MSLIDDMLEGLVGFGRIVSTRLGGAKTVTGKVAGDGGESPDDVEFWGPAGVQSRPPTDAEVLFLRRGDELVGIAFKSRQWQVDVVDGEVAVHALGNSGGTQAVLRLQPDGTAIIDGVSIKAGALAVGLVANGTNLAPHLTAISIGLDALSTLIAGGVPTPQPNYGAVAKAVLDASNPVPFTKTRAT